MLYIDCDPVENVPDMGIYENCFWVSIISSDETGTWIQDRKLGTVELWKKGTRFEKIVLNREDFYNVSAYKLENAIVVHSGQTIEVYDLLGYSVFSSRDIVDCYPSNGQILCSNFEHENYAITEDGSIQELETNFVRFPGENKTLEEASETALLTKVINEYFNNNWDGNCKVFGDTFVAVDYYGNIVANNKVIGNVSLGTEYVATTGANVYLSTEKSFLADGKQLICFENGKKTCVDIPNGNLEFLWISDEEIVCQTYGEKGNTIFIVNPYHNTVKVISENCVDANVAYDTLYFMVDDDVYSLEWTENEKATLFFSGAYAVSLHSDEAEGAIVPEEKANYACYGYKNLFSPYGE